MTRRTDNELREAIDDVKDPSHFPHSIKDIYDKLLTQTMQVTKSNLGFLYSYNEHDEDAEIENHFVQVSAFCLSEGLASHPANCKVVPESERNFNSDIFSKWESQLKRGESISFIKPYSAELVDSLPENLTNAPNICLIPVMDKGRCYAIILLANDLPLGSEQLHRLWPLLAAVTTIRNTYLSHYNSSFSDKFDQNISQPISDSSFKQLFSQLQNYSFNAVIVTNSNCMILSVNRVAKVMFGVADDKVVIGRALSDFIIETFPNELQVRTSSFNQMEAIKNRFFSSKMQCKSSGGRILQVEMTFFQYRLNGEICNLFLLDDKTSLVKEQQFREEEERRFLAVADLVPIGILQTNDRWECEYVNTAWCDMAGLGREEVQGHGWVNALHESDFQRILNDMSSEISKGNRYEETCRFQNPFGELLWVDLNASPLISEDGIIEGFIATANDVTLHRNTEEKLRRVAQFDPLTQLANRSLLNDRLAHLLTRLPRSNMRAAILYIDLDGFKHINDSLGHDCGDLILKEVAVRLMECVRLSDTVSRLGGDEFTIILEDIREAYTASEVAEKIIARIAQPFKIENQEIFLTTSIGITVTSRENLEANQLLKQADIALYHAKGEGRNNYQYYSPDLESNSHQRLQMGNLLHRGLERKEFQVYFQPQANLESGEIIGFEALLRWIPESGVEVPTSEFIPLLEETGLIQGVGRWLTGEALKHYQNWVNKGLISEETHLCINLSPRQFRDKQLVAAIEHSMKTTGVRPQSIVFEITETLLLDDTERYLDLINSIKELGALIALDDFGTGFSSLSHLKNFPIDIIKIDQSFVRDVLEDKEAEAIIRAVLAMSDSLDKTTIAEGVDTDDKLRYLQQLGCQQYQGFLLSRAIPPDEIEVLLLANKKSELSKTINQNSSINLH